MKRFKQFYKWMKGFVHLYVGAVVILFALQYFRTLTPLFIQHIVDHIFNDQPSALPAFIVNIVTADTVVRSLLLVAIFSVVFTLFRVVFFFVHRVLASTFAENVAYRMRNKLYNILQDMSFSAHTNTETGDIIQRCTTDVDTYRMFIGEQMIEVLRLVFLMVFATFQMAIMNPTLTIISLAVSPIIFLSAFIYFIYVKRVFRRVEEAEGTMTTTLQENLTGTRVVKAFNNEAFEIKKFDDISKTFRDESYTLLKLMAYFWSATDFLIFIQYCLTASFGIYFTVVGRMGVGEYIAFLALVGMIVWPMRQLGRIVGDFGKTTVALDRIDDIIAEPSEHENDAEDTPDVRGHIRFENVSFQFEDDTKPLLKNISFDVSQGETLAIIGKTGSGKSTLINLMVRLLESTSGTIYLDGKDIRTVNKKWLRKHIGIILQEPFLFSKTVYDNIGIIDRDASKEKVFNAASIARVHDDILDFEAGYETLVGERGVTLSGGQKQRVAIARMLLDDKPVLIFDDSLSAVDTETDIQIRHALGSYWQDTTVIIITHRIISAKEADRIIVLDKGEIIERGTHEDLLAKNGHYAELWRIQTALDANIGHDGDNGGEQG